jgi:hypothetical protein
VRTPSTTAATNHNLEFFLPDAPTVDVIITTRYVRAAEMTTLVAVEVGRWRP